MNRYIVLVFCSLLTAYSSLALSQEGEAIQILANETYYDPNEAMSVYQGDVTFAQGRYVIYAEKAEVFEKTKRAIISGNPVAFSVDSVHEEEKGEGTANEIVVDYGNGQLQLTGSVTISHGSMSLTAHMAQYNLDSGEIRTTSELNEDGAVRERAMITIESQ